MVSKDDLIAWSIKRYKEDGGDGTPDADASSVLPTKVQVRNSNGDLLKEYDKDFVEFKAKEKGKKTSQQNVGPNPKFAVFALAGIAVIAGVATSIKTTTGTGGGWLGNETRTMTTPPQPQPENDGPSAGGGFNPFQPKTQRRIKVHEAVNPDAWGNVAHEVCRRRLNAISSAEFDALLANGAKVIGTPVKYDASLPSSVLTCYGTTYIIEQ